MFGHKTSEEATFESARHWRRMKTFFTSLLILTTIALFAAVLADDSAPKQESKPSTPTNEPAQKTEIAWHKYDEGLKLAKQENKKVFVEFTAKWCGYCKKMRATTFRDQGVIDLLGKYYISVSVDGDSRDTLNIDGWITSEYAMAREFGVSAYPTFWFLSPGAEPIAPLKGYRDKETLSQILDYLKDDLYKTVTFEDFLKDKKKP
jgi:thioredoxin-related protein